MYRAIVVTVMVSTTIVVPAWGQEVGSQQPARSGAFLLYETAIGARLGRRPDNNVNDTRWYATWELGPMFNRGSSAWGATLLGAADEDGSRWGVRPRYRKWLGTRASLDLGAGVLIGGSSNGVEQTYPGFTGLLGLRYGDWLGVNLEIHAIPTAQAERYYYDPATSQERTAAAREFTDWGVHLGARVGGLAAVLVSAAELVLVVIAASSYSGW